MPVMHGGRLTFPVQVWRSDRVPGKDSPDNEKDEVRPRRPGQREHLPA